MEPYFPHESKESRAEGQILCSTLTAHRQNTAFILLILSTEVVEKSEDSYSSTDEPLTSKFYAGLAVGYSTELMEEYVNGGLTYGAFLGYRFTPKISLGFHLQETSAEFAGEVTVSNGVTTFTQEVAESFSASFIMGDLIYNMNKSFYLGLSGGMAKYTHEEFGDTFMAFGGLVGYDYYFNPNISLGARSYMSYVMVTESDLLDKAFFMDFLVSGTYHF